MGLSKVVTLPHLLDSLLLGFLLLLFIPASFPFINSLLISKLGGTLGKILYGLEIVRETNSEKLTFWRAFFRNQIGYSVSGALLGLGFTWIWVDAKRRGWHDLISDTIVVVKNKSLWIFGLILTIILISANIVLINFSFKNFLNNKDLYYGLFEDISNEIEAIDNNENPSLKLPDDLETSPINTI